MLLGENGAGKSTLMKILSGAYRKDAGEIRLNGMAVEIASPRDALAIAASASSTRSSTSFRTCRSPRTFFWASCRRRWSGIVDWRALHERTSALLLDLGMTLDPRAPVGRLGLAQRQMVEIAKALAPAFARASAGQAGDAAILVMDEPTSALTSREVTQLFALIERLDRARRLRHLHHASSRRGVPHRPAYHRHA